MAQAQDVEALTAIVNPITGRLVDVWNVEPTTSGTVRITDVDGRSFELDAKRDVHVINKPEQPLNWARAIETLCVVFGLVGLLIVLAFLGTP